VSDNSPTLKLIDERLDQYESLTSWERKTLFSDLQQLGEIYLTAGKLPEVESVCPVTKQELVAPCQLKGCRYWVEHSWTKNCALNFMAAQGVDQLSPEQVSLLYRKSVERVKSIYSRSFKITQRHYLRATLRNKGVPQYQHQPGFCVACQTKLLSEDLADEALRLQDGFGYCSSECKKQFPPNYFDIENFFQSDFYRVIQIGSELFNFYYLEEILGFQPNVLRNRLEKLREPAGEKKKANPLR
jgi:hypothetical protein